MAARDPAIRQAFRAAAAAVLTLSSTSRMNSSSRRLTLLRMLVTSDALRGELREDVVQALRLGHLDFQGMIVGRARREPGELRSGALRGVAQVEHEHFGLQLAQHVGHAVALDDVAAFDDGDVAAQVLRLFEIVRRQDDGGALRR